MSAVLQVVVILAVVVIVIVVVVVIVPLPQQNMTISYSPNIHRPLAHFHYTTIFCTPSVVVPLPQ